MAVNLSPVAGAAAQFLDNSGNVLTGGKLYTYAAGTTTPQATYTSGAGVTFHSNPIILDAAGRVPAGGEIWLTDGLQYKFVLKDANDVLIGTWDNLIGINSNFLNYYTQQEIQTATAGQTVFTLSTLTYTPGTNSLSVFVDGVNQYDGISYAYVETNSTTVTFTSGLHVGALVKFTTAVTLSSGVTNATLVTYDPPFTASVPTTVELKLAQTISVKDFGAQGDGVTDDTLAIQNAVDYLSTLVESGAFKKMPVLYFPAALYKVSSTIDVQFTSFAMKGDGRDQTTIIWYGGNTPVFDLGVFTTAPSTNVLMYSGIANGFDIRDIAIRNNSANTVGSRVGQGIRVSGSSNGRIERVQTSGFSYGINLSYGCYSTSLIQHISTADDFGIYLGPGCQTTTVSQSTHDFNKYGIVIDRAVQIQVNDYVSNFSNSSAIRFEALSTYGTRQLTSYAPSGLFDQGMFVFNNLWLEGSATDATYTPTYFIESYVDATVDPALRGPVGDCYVNNALMIAGSTVGKTTTALIQGAFTKSYVNGVNLYGDLDYWMYDTQGVQLTNYNVAPGWTAPAIQNNNVFTYSTQNNQDVIFGYFPYQTSSAVFSSNYGVQTSVEGNGQLQYGYWNGAAWVPRIGFDVQNTRLYMGGDITSGTKPTSISFGSTAPASGNYAQGSIVYNTSATSGGYVGWVCTVAGTPGTWKTFGVIS